MCITSEVVTLRLHSLQVLHVQMQCTTISFAQEVAWMSLVIAKHLQIELQTTLPLMELIALN